jgi:serine/threonine protein kinase
LQRYNFKVSSYGVKFYSNLELEPAIKQLIVETNSDKIPISVNRIILKAMQKDPSLRYQSATEMIKDLKNALKNPEGDFVGEVKMEAVAPVNEAVSRRAKEMKDTHHYQLKDNEYKSDKNIGKALEEISKNMIKFEKQK